MPMFRVSYFFEQGQWGWSESVHNLNTSYNAVAADAANLRDARINMLPPSAQLAYIRISDDLVFRDSTLISEKASSPGARAIEFSDPTFAAYLIRMYSSPTVRRSMYVRPVAAGDGQDGDRVVNSALWLGAYNTWKGLLQNEATGWAIKSQTVAGVGQIVTGLSLTGTTLSIIAPGAMWAVGQKIKLQGFKTNPNVNGSYTIIATPAADSFTLSPNLAADTLEITKHGFAFAWSYTLSKIASVSVIRITSRKTGRPFDSPRGRSGTAR